MAKGLADERVTDAERNRLHMEQVRAVHRRSAYERVSERIRFIEQARVEADAGLRPPPAPYMLDELQHLLKLREAILSEMIAAGQVL